MADDCTCVRALGTAPIRAMEPDSVLTSIVFVSGIFLGPMLGLAALGHIFCIIKLMFFCVGEKSR